MAMTRMRSMLIVSGGAAVAALFVAGCQMAGRSPDAGAGTAPASANAAPAAPSGKSGAELWASTCGHCHNIRSPSSYGPAQWEVAVNDMRVRANLTGEEQRKITEFLKAASQ
jgi:cytochrome c5